MNILSKISSNVYFWIRTLVFATIQWGLRILLNPLDHDVSGNDVADYDSSKEEGREGGEEEEEEEKNY